MFSKANPLFLQLLIKIHDLEEDDIFDECAQPEEECTPNFSDFIQNQFFQRQTLAYKFEISDLQCLDGCEWVNDAVLNSYLSFCYNNITDTNTKKIGLTNSFFTKMLERSGCAEAACWQGIKNRPINQYDIFLIPICHGYHWILAVVNFTENEIQIYDSLHYKYQNVVKTINEFLEFQGLEKMKATYPQVPLQRNGYDCGVFVMQFGKCIMHNISMNSFDQKDIPSMRKKIRQELFSLIKSM